MSTHGGASACWGPLEDSRAGSQNLAGNADESESLNVMKTAATMVTFGAWLEHALDNVVHGEIVLLGPDSRWHRTISVLARYCVAVLCVAAAVSATSLLDQHFGIRDAFILAIAAMLAAHFGGLGPGILGTVLAALSIDYFLQEPRGSLYIKTVGDFMVLVTFVAFGLATNLILSAARNGWHVSQQLSGALVEELARAHADRIDLLRQTIESQEMERRRVARELHDSVGQYLVLLRFGIRSLENRLRGDAWLLERLAEMRQHTTDIGEEVRRLAWELRPAALDGLGLERAVSQFINEWSSRFGISVEFHFGLGSERPPAEIETTLYRVFQEAMTNVAKHAEADHVGVLIEEADNKIRMVIEDNGRGFSQAELGKGEVSRRGFGLLGISERAALAGGTFEVETAPGRGTHLFIILPNGKREAS